TNTGYFEYLAYTTGLGVGEPAARVVAPAKGMQRPKQMMLMSMQPSGATTAPSGDLPWIILPDGWIYLVGDMPCIATESGYACAEGSTIIVQRSVTRDNKNCDRFIMLRTHRARSGQVTTLRTPTEKVVKFKGKGASYIDVPTDGSDPYPAEK